MKTSKCLIVVAMFAWSMMAAAQWPRGLQAPLENGAFETGQYRNLFVEMGYRPNEVEQKLKEVFNDVFHGPNKVYFEVGDTMGYVSDIKNHDVRTEGMSYGMMIAVEMDEKISSTACGAGLRNTCSIRKDRVRDISPGAARPTAPATPKEQPPMVNCISSPR